MLLLPTGIPQLTTNPLPTGAIGIWYAKTLTTVGGNPVVPNVLSAVPASANLIRFPRRNFTSSESISRWTGSNVVVTDNAVVGPDGRTQASTVVGTGVWSLFYGPSIGAGTSNPGTYTIGCSVKRNTGSDQSFKLGNAADSNISGTLTATASWQRFAFTFTLAAATNLNPQISFGTSQNLQICDLEVFAGSSDLGPSTLAGHFYPGSGAFAANQPTLSSGVLDFGSDGAHFGSLQFLDPASVTNTFTLLFVSKITAGTLTNNGYFICRANDSAKLSYAYNSGGQAMVNWGSNGSASGGQHTGLSSLSGTNWNVVGVRNDATNLDFFINGLLYRRHGSPAQASNPTVFDNLYIGIGEVFGGDGIPGQMASWAIWPRALSNAEVRTATQILSANSGVTINNTHVVIFEGDSVTDDVGFCPTTFGYAYYAGQQASPPLFGANYAIGGASLQNNAGNDLITRAASGLVDLCAQSLGAFPSHTKPIFSVMIGINDINGFVANGYFNGVPGKLIPDWLNDYAAYLDARRAAGYIVVVCTNFSGQVAGGTFEMTRQTIATTIRTWPGLHCDYVVDFSNLATTMGADGASVTLQGIDFAGTPNNQHPNDAGTILLETEYTAVVNTIP